MQAPMDGYDPYAGYQPTTSRMWSSWLQRARAGQPLAGRLAMTPGRLDPSGGHEPGGVVGPGPIAVTPGRVLGPIPYTPPNDFPQGAGTRGPQESRSDVGTPLMALPYTPPNEFPLPPLTTPIDQPHMASLPGSVGGVPPMGGLPANPYRDAFRRYATAGQMGRPMSGGGGGLNSYGQWYQQGRGWGATPADRSLDPQRPQY